MADQPQLKQIVFADKKDITAPTGLSVSPRGDVYVSCDRNGATNTKSGIGYVIRCIDSNGDGKADQFNNFIENIDSPRGSCFVDKTLYLMNPPFLTAYRDTNGDGKADESKVLIRNLGRPLTEIKVDHGQNGVRMGIDGWLYLAIGDQGCYNATGTDNSQVTLYGGGVLRVRPDGSQLEVIAINTRNIYDVAVSPYLDLFARDNTNDGGGWNVRFHYITELADFGYPTRYKYFGHEIMQSLVDYGGGSGTGMYYIHEPGLPQKYQQGLISCDWGRGLNFHKLKKHAESFRIHQEKFMKVGRSMDLDVDGSGRLYAASWKGGKFGYVEKHEAFGEIILIQSSEQSNTPFPDLEATLPGQLVKYVVSESQVLRLNAMMAILRHKDKASIAELLQNFLKHRDAPLYAKIAALFTLRQISGSTKDEFFFKLYEDPHIREYVIRALSDNDHKGSYSNIYVKGLEDSNPRVQLRAIIAIARCKATELAASLFPFTAPEKLIVNSFDTKPAPVDLQGWSAPHNALSHTAIKALVKLNAVDACIQKLKEPEYRQAALRCLQEIHTKEVIQKLTEQISTDKTLNKLILVSLFRLYHKEKDWTGKTWWGTRPNHQGPYFNPVEWHGTPAVINAINKAFKFIAEKDIPTLLKFMQVNHIPFKKLDTGIKQDPLSAVLEKGILDDADLTFLSKCSVDTKQASKVRLKAYRKIIDNGNNFKLRVKIHTSWLNEDELPEALQHSYNDFIQGNDFIDELSLLQKMTRENPSKPACQILLNLAKNPVIPAEKKEKIDAIINTAWNELRPTRGLLQALLEAPDRKYMNKIQKCLESPDKSTKKHALKLIETLSTINSKVGQKIAGLPPKKVISLVLKSRGDLKLGKKIFTRQGCTICHTTSLQEELKGPYLGSAGNKFDRTFLTEAIILPNKVIAQGFKTQWFKVKSGILYEGFVTKLDGKKIEIRNIT
ncbi:MAG: hypothetical protein HRU15_00170, partial [Planctomycetes bacterium]|nr:hypothetical protein [Planctomycetota bacterium]